MDIKEAIFGRRSIRKYEDKAISDQDIQDILDAGMMAPSAVNLQPWYFVVVKSEEKMNDVIEVMGNTSDKVYPALATQFERHPEVAEETKKFIGLLGGAPICIMVFEYKTDYEKDEFSIIQSASAAIQNMLLMAYSKGIGSCWLTAPLEAGTDKILKEKYAPDKGNMVALLTFGYPTGEPVMPKRREGRFEII